MLQRWIAVCQGDRGDSKQFLPISEDQSPSQSGSWLCRGHLSLLNSEAMKCVSVLLILSWLKFSMCTLKVSWITGNGRCMCVRGEKERTRKRQHRLKWSLQCLVAGFQARSNRSVTPAGQFPHLLTWFFFTWRKCIRSKYVAHRKGIWTTCIFFPVCSWQVWFGTSSFEEHSAQQGSEWKSQSNIILHNRDREREKGGEESNWETGSSNTSATLACVQPFRPMNIQNLLNSMAVENHFGHVVLRKTVRSYSFIKATPAGMTGMPIIQTLSIYLLIKQERREYMWGCVYMCLLMPRNWMTLSFFNGDCLTNFSGKGIFFQQLDASHYLRRETNSTSYKCFESPVFSALFRLCFRSLFCFSLSLSLSVS